MKKKILNEQRLRQIPAHFSWIDHRLIRNGLLKGCPSESWALYLFLVTVGDSKGISYYSEHRLGEHLGFCAQSLNKARRHLLESDLIAWEAPYYQVLEIPSSQSCWPLNNKRKETVMSIGELFKNIAQEGGVS